MALIAQILPIHAVDASADIEAWAREPFAIGKMHDAPIDAAERMGWEVVGPASAGIGMSWALIAQAADGRRFRVHWAAGGCMAREIADGKAAA